MKIWCFLYRDSANRWREYDRCGVASPWPRLKEYFGENSWYFAADDGKNESNPRIHKGKLEGGDISLLGQPFAG